MTYAEYLTLEDGNLDAKHEFLDGEVHAMAGGTPDHGAVATRPGSCSTAHERRAR
jgi:hypothetical protein